MTATHTVINQVPPLAGNAFRDDPLLLQLASGTPEAQLREWQQIGAYVRSAEAQDLARLFGCARGPKQRPARRKRADCPQAYDGSAHDGPPVPPLYPGFPQLEGKPSGWTGRRFGLSSWCNVILTDPAARGRP